MALYGNFDIIYDYEYEFEGRGGALTTPHGPCFMIYVLAALVGCWLTLAIQCDPMLCPFHVVCRYWELYSNNSTVPLVPAPGTGGSPPQYHALHAYFTAARSETAAGDLNSTQVRQWAAQYWKGRRYE